MISSEPSSAAHPDVVRLLALVPPPPPPTAQRRATIVMPPGLPLDYRQLCILYGAGSFSDFFWVLQPDCANPHLDLGQRGAELVRQLDVEFSWDGGFGMPRTAAPRDVRQLPWAVTDNGDVLWWKVEGPEDEWTTIITEGGGDEVHECAGGAALLLGDLLDGSLRVEFLPADLSPSFVADPAVVEPRVHPPRLSR